MKRILYWAMCAVLAVNAVIFAVALVLTCLGGPSATYHGPGIVFDPPIPTVTAPATVTKAPPVKTGHVIRAIWRLFH